MKLTGFEVIKLGITFLCYRSVFEITLVLPHQYKNFKNYQTGFSSFSWPLVCIRPFSTRLKFRYHFSTSDRVDYLSIGERSDLGRFFSRKVYFVHAQIWFFAVELNPFAK